ncbi:hypothetical protein Smic_52700 [Streptomyces microflavus]|uniref:Uncharacterized protein n=1 Tax=Streptomyces microflavus TaxID=1919 RepID=A0A7J0CXU0_STRMI|nr:hypothetical protein Smic_52700 [Streptomyces microflavus]
MPVEGQSVGYAVRGQRGDALGARPGASRHKPVRSAAPVAYSTYVAPPGAWTMPVVMGKPRTGVLTPASAGAGRVARMRVVPRGVIRAIWRPAAKVMCAEPSGSRAMFSGSWPAARSKWDAIRTSLRGLGSVGVASAGRATARAAATEAATVATMLLRWGMGDMGSFTVLRRAGMLQPGWVPRGGKPVGAG